MTGRAGDLTILDMAVLMGVVQGQSNDDIAGDLEIAVETAAAVRAQLFAKYEVSGLNELRLAALERGPISWIPDLRGDGDADPEARAA